MSNENTATAKIKIITLNGYKRDLEKGRKLRVRGNNEDGSMLNEDKIK